MSTQPAAPLFSFADGVPAGLLSAVGKPGSEFLPSAEREIFFPSEPKTLKDSGLTAVEVEALILKQLYSSGSCTGRKIAEQIRLPFPIVQEALRESKQQLLVAYKNAAAMGDYDHELTESGTLRAKWHLERCTYCGSAPVAFADYERSVRAQSVRNCKPKLPDIVAALSELSIPPSLISSIGQAVRAGKGMFIHGQPGNGKTSIAERLVRSLSTHVWIPRTITMGGEIVRLYDPSNHEEAALSVSQNLMSESALDRRWVRIKRPAIIVGGELTFQQLELSANQQTGIIEAPVQMKANCGALVVDDFGRQRISTTELLNRWIVPLEKGIDFLALPSGRQIQVPFDQLLVFSTNLEPRTLVDEAFLRRIPYKIEVQDPTAKEFCELFLKTASAMGLACQPPALKYLLEAHYGPKKLPLRYCHARDLLSQVRVLCEFHDLPLEVTPGALDVAVNNYFGSLGMML